MLVATAPWQQDLVDGANTLVGLTCPSISFCGPMDDAGRIFTSIDPSSARSRWSPATVPALENAGEYATPAAPGISFFYDHGIICASLRLCIAYDRLPLGAGHFSTQVIAATARPLGSADDWSVSELSPAGVTALACPWGDPDLHPSDGLGVGVEAGAGPCSSVDLVSGRVAVRRRRTSRGRDLDHADGRREGLEVHAHRQRPDPRANGPKSAINDVACPTTRLCVALDDGANLFTSINPTGGARASKRVHLRFTAGLLTCPSAVMCVAIDSEGDAVTTTDSTGGPGAWTITPLDPVHQLSSLACPTMSAASPATTRQPVHRVRPTRPHTRSSRDRTVRHATPLLPKSRDRPTHTNVLGDQG